MWPRVARELDAVDDFLREAALRKHGATTALPKTSKGLRDLAASNGLNFLRQPDRAKASRLLAKLQAEAPIMHVSFAADPSAAFVGKIVTYLRQNIHPYVLVQIGLQPSIAAGCTVRTTNKYFDFSLRQHLLKNRQLLIKALAKLDQASRRPRFESAAVPAHQTPPASQPEPDHE